MIDKLLFSGYYQIMGDEYCNECMNKDQLVIGFHITGMKSIKFFFCEKHRVLGLRKLAHFSKNNKTEHLPKVTMFRECQSGSCLNPVCFVYEFWCNNDRYEECFCQKHKKNGEKDIITLSNAKVIMNKSNNQK